MGRVKSSNAPGLRREPGWMIAGANGEGGSAGARL